MTRFWGAVLFLVLVGPAGAEGVVETMGIGKDPAEILTKTWEWDRVRTFEARGWVDLRVRQGPKPVLTVTASRALLGQLSVTNWWGWAAVAIESGLQGPREQGKVEVTLEVPDLEELTIADHSSARVLWPGPRGRLRVLDSSGATLELRAEEFTVEASWHSSVTVFGTVTALSVGLRHGSQVESVGTLTQSVRATLAEDSTFHPGPTGEGTGQTRRGSRIDVPEGQAPVWSLTEVP